MDSYRRPLCVDGHRGRHTDTHGQPQTSCVCWRTPTDVLCVLTRQPTWAKITRTVHMKVHRAESKDQRADTGTDGQPRTTNVLICVLMDRHERPVCADGHTRTATDVLCMLTDTHGPTDVLCLLADTHRRYVCTEQTGYVGQNHPKSPREGPAC
ncbi:unnamed protein product [Brassica rapa]|uniref:Uncharacterized protein n=1 Tax=Brassica campestris TaxID=3711 RepID=A0A8D9DB98_BRACM|nr:unnamed protein product [Brassica rapa]